MDIRVSKRHPDTPLAKGLLQALQVLNLDSAICLPPNPQPPPPPQKKVLKVCFLAFSKLQVEQMSSICQ